MTGKEPRRTMTRRNAAKAAAITALSYSRILGGNDRIGLGVIGNGERGTYVMTLFQKDPEIEVRALCDVWGDRMDQAQRKAPNTKTFADHRQLLELQEVDAVLVASPDHWHKDHAIDTINAGKDVYCEKPMCRTMDAAPLMVKASRATKRICQIGMQQRSGQVYIESKEKFIDTGVIGKINQIDAVWHSALPQPLPKEPTQKPANLDWLRFLGPVRYRDWNPAQYLDFRSVLDFNGGRMTDLDIIGSMPCICTWASAPRMRRSVRVASSTTSTTAGRRLTRSTPFSSTMASRSCFSPTPAYSARSGASRSMATMASCS